MPAIVRGEIIGRYELLAQLSAGGMSQLFLGATTEADGARRFVVIKRIVPDSASDEILRSMFIDEARITAGFSHKNIVQVLDLGEATGGLYVAMELISGANLNEVFDACARAQHILPLGFSASVAHDCALALHYAHTFRTKAGTDASVIHRDVAQKNIMVTYDGSVKLLDFGIAKVRNALSQTKAGTVKGTAGYMSPEQVRGEPLDGRSDVFALGIVLWEMITGKRLFEGGSDVEEMKLILNSSIRAPHEVAEWIPKSLSEVTMKALARPLNERFSSARELARALELHCGDVLYDAQQRTEFMHALFKERIAANQALLDAGQHPLNARFVDEALHGLELQAIAIKPLARTLQPTKDDRLKTSPIEERLLLQAFESQRRSQRPRGSMPLVFAALSLLCVGLAYTIFVTERPARGVSLRLGGQLPGVNTTAEAPVLKVEKPIERSAVSQADITLAIFPEASVFRGREKLGSGNLISFALPEGTHLLTLVGADGIHHVLPLVLAAGKNKPRRFRLEDLPVQ